MCLNNFSHQNIRTAETRGLVDHKIVNSGLQVDFQVSLVSFNNFFDGSKLTGSVALKPISEFNWLWPDHNLLVFFHSSCHEFKHFSAEYKYPTLIWQLISFLLYSSFFGRSVPVTSTYWGFVNHKGWHNTATEKKQENSVTSHTSHRRFCGGTTPPLPSTNHPTLHTQNGKMTKWTASNS